MPAMDRVARRLRSPAMREFYRAWMSLRPAGDLPRLADFDFDSLAINADLAIAEPVPGTLPVCFALIRVGRNLSARAGRPLLNMRVGGVTDDPPGDPMGAAAWAYRRCLDNAAPSYESMQIGFGEDGPLWFERLLLPVGERGRPTHLLVATQFSEPAVPDLAAGQALD